MKRLLAVILLFLVLPRDILAQDSGWEITSFGVNLDVSENSNLTVEETIGVDFDDLDKHGIFRTIPYKYLDQYRNLREIDLAIDEVMMDGREIPYSVSRSSGNVVVKIGDPNRTISGVHEYAVHYRVQRAINYFDDYDELYWNVTGDEWPVTMREVSVMLTAASLPQQTRCFAGPAGSTEACLTDMEYAGAVRYAAQEPLAAGEGLTIVAGFDKGFLHEPSLLTSMWWRLRDNWGYLIPVITLIGLVYLYLVSGRDNYYVDHFDSQRGEKPIPLLASPVVGDVYYPPDNMTAAEAGVLIDERAQAQDLAAVLIGLAEKGYLIIEEAGQKDFIFHRVESTTNHPLETYEKEFLDGLFASGETVFLKKLKYTFTPTAERVKNLLYEAVHNEGYFVQRPDRVRVMYLVLAIGTGVLGFMVLVGGVESIMGTAPGIGLIVSAVMIALSSLAMPKRTAKGQQKLVEILGLKRVISLGAYRQELFEKHNYFTEILPYAIAFGLTKQWAKTVAKLHISQPIWYQSAMPFQPTNFSHSMSRLSTTTASTLTAVKSTAASSGGSGFSGGGSGGGFGGGGGGSW